MTAVIKPFKIAVPDSAIQQLRDKLAVATFPDEVEFSDNWNYGAPLSDVKRLATRWRDGFDWRAAEAKLNELLQFTTKVNVDGFGDLDIHFIHKRSTKPGSIPLLFVHGWPGSFYEAVKLVPLLTDPTGEGPSFHVVAPSLPNYGFSDVVTKEGFDVPKYAETMHKVMLALGYNKYVTQGGDWGFFITRQIASLYPDHCMATHVNFVCVKEPPKFSKQPLLYLQHAVSPYAEHEKKGIARSKWFESEGFGYNLTQATKPSTLGFALSDSPVALLAWIYEKLHDWTDSYPWTDDEVLTWISIYQFSKAGPAANVRIYYENRHTHQEQTRKSVGYIPSVPLGLSYFPRDLCVPPQAWGKTLGPVIFEAVHPDGGHFAAHERPKELADDLKRMFGKGGGASQVTQVFKGKL